MESSKHRDGENNKAEIGDLTAKNNIHREEKYQREWTAMTNLVLRSKNGEKVIKLWKGYKIKETDKTIFAFLLDKFQSVIQAKEYANKYQMQELYEEFLNWYEPLTTKYKSISPRIAKILTLKK